MAQERTQAPQGMAGLVRYYDEDTALIKLKPEYVVALCAGLVVLEVLLYMMASTSL